MSKVINPTKVITGKRTVMSYLNVNEPKTPMGGGALEDLKTPLRDGDKERKGDDAYKGSYFVNANSTTKPGVVDADRNPILDSSELYSGIIGRASINFYAFNSNGNRGIACGLNNIQKLADGTPLGGHSRAEDDFADLDDDDDEDFLS